MDRNNVYMFLMFRIIFLQIREMTPLKTSNDFRFTQCRWDGNSCEEIYTKPKKQVSEWPPGPYALPMPVDGCPETRWKGWEEGYIEFTWQDPHAVLSEEISVDENNNTNSMPGDLKDITQAKVTEIQSIIMGPYGRYKFRLNFCYKQRSYASLDIGNWTHASYGIYGNVNGCPNGFTVKDRRFQLPKASFWISDGYLPYFKLIRHNESDELVLRSCWRIMTDDVATTNGLPADTSFILLQDDSTEDYGSSCYINSELEGTAVNLYLREVLPGPYLYNSTMMHLMSICSFRPYKWLHGKTDMNDTLPMVTEDILNKSFFGYSNVNITVGNVLVNSYSYSWRQTGGETNAINDIIAHFVKGSIRVEWTLLDVGRTVSVIGLYINAKPDMNDLAFPRCFISNGKWDFLHFKALSCFFKVFLDSLTDTQTTAYFIFNRVMEGRFVLLAENIRDVIIDKRVTFEEYVQITVLTNEEIYGYLSEQDLLSNSDLGMEDFRIDDQGISSSSQRQSFPAQNARPNFSGWCADVNDIYPYIMARLDQDSIIDGITIMNWEDTFRTAVNGIGEQQFFRIGTSSFKIAHGLTEDNLTYYSKFQVDLLFNANEPQYFRFYRPFLAKFVKIFDIEPLFQDMKCVRFEIHGCRKKGIKDFQCVNSQTMKRYDGLVNPQDIGAFEWHNRSVEFCENACAENDTCAMINSYFENGDCLLYDTRNTDTRQEMVWNLQESNVGYTSVKICNSDYISTPRVMYSHSKGHSGTGTIVSYIAFVRDQSDAISSIGYPFEYGFGEKYKWVIQFNEEEYIRIVFTNILLTIQECNDTITLDEERAVFGMGTDDADKYGVDGNYGTPDTVFTLDHLYNRRQLVIDTQVNHLILTFTSCSYHGDVTFRGRGFRAIVQKRDLPTCFNFHNFDPDYRPMEMCSLPVMYLSSLEYNNILYTQARDFWTITSKTQTFRLKMLHFYVQCNEGSAFVIRESLRNDLEYCNLLKPPVIILTNTRSVMVFLNTHFTLQDRFSLIYESLDDEPLATEVLRKTFERGLQDSALFEAHDAHPNNIVLMAIKYGEKLAAAIIEALFVRMKVPQLLHKACSKHFNKCYTIYASKDGTWDGAGSECWLRRQRLVSIRSVDELKLVRYLMRTFKRMAQDSKIFEDAFIHNKTVFYYTYIGNRRGIDSKRKIYEFWENKTPVLFSAWGNDEPLDGECTRMSFHFANEDNTWEATECSTHTAYYFICEQEIGDTDIEQLLTEVTPVYRFESTSKEKNVQRCMEQFLFYNKTLVKSIDDCVKRTFDPSYDLMTCTNTINDAEMDENCESTCFTVHRPYNGSQNSTVSGKPCVNWKMHFKKKTFDLLNFPDKKFADASNYCRDPFSSGFQWCFTSYPAYEWEICSVNYSLSVQDKQHQDSDRVGANPMFMCQSGDYIEAFKVCNGIVDCFDVSDELNCPPKPHQLLNSTSSIISGESSPNVDHGSIFKCGSNEWISYLEYCNGIVDCGDASDESNCTDTESAKDGCARDQFKCGNGVCIHISLVCNFIQDCSDNTDEQCDFLDCDYEEFTCANGQCIQSDRRCDAFEDCWDGSDETNCQTCSSSEVFNCDFVRCIPLRLVCDGYPDCEDKTDESSCDGNRFGKCRELWEAGYRESKEYIVQDAYYTQTITVYCDFSSILTDQVINTIFYVDLVYWNGETDFYTTFIDFTFSGNEPFDDVREQELSTNCSYQVIQTCYPWVNTIAVIEDPYLNNTYKHCRCLNVTLELGFLETFIVSASDCITGELLSVDKFDQVLFNYSRFSGIYMEDPDMEKEIHLQVDHAVCVEAYLSDVTTFGCGEPDKVFDLSWMCVYDTDRSGTIIGCRTGSHLHNCEFYECPAGTVKCPRSYCIPLRFVCDGVEHCSNAEDEYECGCSDSEREVIIMRHKDSDVTGLDMIGIAQQLHSSNGIIKSAVYKLEGELYGIPFRHKILNITEKEIRPSVLTDREHSCNYKILANDFIDRVEFTKRTLRTLVFIQNNDESQMLAELMFSKSAAFFSDYSVYRISEGVKNTTTKAQHLHGKEVYVNNWKLLSTMIARYLPNICEEKSMNYCPGAYKCAFSKMCIELQQVCDGHRHCKHGDDELFCEFRCPSNCTCTGLLAKCSEGIFQEELNALRNFPRTIRSLELSNLQVDQDLALQSDILHFPFLYSLNMSNSGLKSIEKGSFAKLSNLKILDLRFNKLSQLRKGVFAGLKNMHQLFLDGNYDLSSLDPKSFQDLESIRMLRITGTKLKVIKSNTFAGLNLEILDLRNNEISSIEEFGLGNLAVNHINFQGNDVVDFHKGVFTGVTSLEYLLTSAYKFCCIRPNYVLESNCFPSKDEFSSCEDLMRISALQTMLWLIGLCALLGNSLSVVYRLSFDRTRLKLGYGVFVTNLAVADFLMGVYLIIIAVADAVFRKRYIFMDDYWRNSSWCTLSGVLSTLSSEASVMFLCLITIDRFLVIKYPFGQVRLNTKKASLISVAAWILSLLISLIPIFFAGYFQNKFYNKSGVCIALPLTRDRPPGWLYSILVFIGLNFVTFLIVAAGQWSIYIEISKTSGKLRKSQSRRKDLLVARNLLLVVATDFLCWFPIGCMGLMALSGYAISGDVYAWAAVFILPVNSALNPILYTLTAILGKKSFTPSTSELNKTNLQTVKAKQFLVNQKITAFRFDLTGRRSRTQYLTVYDYLLNYDVLPHEAIVRIVYQLAECLLVLHKNGLVLDEIDVQTVYINADQNKVRYEVQLRHEPTVCTKAIGKPKDILQLGMLLQTMILKSKRSSLRPFNFYD